MTKLLLALDFGGTKHAAAVVAPGERNFQDCRRALSPAGADAGTDRKIMRSLAREVLGGEEPLAIGVSFGGPVDATTGTVRLSDRVLGWENTPLRQMREEEFGVPVSVGKRGDRKGRLGPRSRDWQRRQRDKSPGFCSGRRRHQSR
ncbi:ROK family protein [Kamptonema formosum]|uniref:ROK family protein n=1 Tax=Kamptonema formosum TaxID=331992 RepID=UPI00034BC90C|nr:ROK family protein [Oscillatoria sp. PCC 10802]